MAGEWRTKTLGEVCSTITDVAHQSPKTVQSGMPMASVKDLNFWGLDLDSARHISYEDYEALVRQGCKPLVGDVLIAKDGNSALDTVCVIEDPIDVVLLSSIAILRPDPDQIDSKYLKYYFMTPSVIDYLKTNFISGAAIPRVVLRDFKRAKISLPNLEEQESIAYILGTLDDKIELNRRMNETLEAIARAIFKSWFVDFDPVRAKASGEPPESICRRLRLTPDLLALFPDRLVDSELGEIPEGWEVKPFSETVQIIGGGTPKTSVSEYWGGDIPWFSVVDAPAESDVFVIDTEKKITQAGLENSSARMLSAGTTIISARGTVGKVALVGVPMAMNQSCYGLRGLDGGAFFTYYATRELVSTLKQHSHGAVFDTITRDTFAGVSVVTFQPVATAFETMVAPLMEKIKANSVQGCTLADLRDALLPKLISGELRVPVNPEQIKEII